MGEIVQYLVTLRLFNHKDLKMPENASESELLKWMQEIKQLPKKVLALFLACLEVADIAREDFLEYAYDGEVDLGKIAEEKYEPRIVTSEYEGMATFTGTLVHEKFHFDDLVESLQVAKKLGLDKVFKEQGVKADVLIIGIPEYNRPEEENEYYKRMYVATVELPELKFVAKVVPTPNGKFVSLIQWLPETPREKELEQV